MQMLRFFEKIGSLKSNPYKTCITIIITQIEFWSQLQFFGTLSDSIEKLTIPKPETSNKINSRLLNFKIVKFEN